MTRRRIAAFAIIVAAGGCLVVGGDQNAYAVDAARSTLPGRNGAIAFGTSGGIIIANADGSSHKLRTGLTGGGFVGPDWSPDGKKLLFLHGGVGAQGLVLINADGSGRQTLTTTRYQTRQRGTQTDLLVREGRWAPDARRVAIVAQRYSHKQGFGAVYILDLQSRRLRRFPVGGVQVFSVAWAPDGRRLALAIESNGDDDDCGAGGDIVIASTSGRLVRKISAGYNGSKGGSDWSPDGRQIVYPGATGNFDTVNGCTKGIFVEPHDSTIGLDSGAPTFSPDGRKIAFDAFRPVTERSPTGWINIAIMSSDGTGFHFLTGSSNREGGPDWQRIVR